MNIQTSKIYVEALSARASYVKGDIDRNEAKERIMPYIESYNQKSEQIAKKYNMRPKLISFESFVRP